MRFFEYLPRKKEYRFHEMRNGKFILSGDVCKESRFSFGQINQNLSKHSGDFQRLYNFGELPSSLKCWKYDFFRKMDFFLTGY